ncbi:hypothetical protein [Actinomycetospora chibensis]|uniref:Uncharacterized protein n=1 Tax=Actinomycetospora chibensis TaxID=663606 RepID=A0ABV9RIX1_9PSEU|nr:hypothetical protein [Actinomycetospora chibensis]MDD7927233.1 hypothetical protein [Actinomycetospora chibensis]
MSVTTSSAASTGRVPRPVRVISRIPDAPVPQVRSLPVAAPSSPEVSWRGRLIGDLWLFLAVLAVGVTVAVVAALV